MLEVLSHNGQYSVDCQICEWGHSLWIYGLAKSFHKRWLMIINILTSGHLMAPYRKVKCHMSDVTVEDGAGRRAENWLRLVWGLLLLSCGSCFHCPQPRPLVAQMKVCMSIRVYKFSNGTLIVSMPCLLGIKTSSWMSVIKGLKFCKFPNVFPL